MSVGGKHYGFSQIRKFAPHVVILLDIRRKNVYNSPMIVPGQSGPEESDLFLVLVSQVRSPWIQEYAAAELGYIAKGGYSGCETFYRPVRRKLLNLGRRFNIMKGKVNRRYKDRCFL